MTAVLEAPPRLLDLRTISSARRARWAPDERRDLDARPQRDAVAAYFGIHPSQLSALPAGVIDVMAARLIGDRRRHARLVGQYVVRLRQPSLGERV